MEKSILNAPVATFQVHPEVVKTYREKDLESLHFTMHKYGQQTPIKVIERDGQMYIIDGVSRFKCATQLQLPSLMYDVVTLDDNKVIEYRMLSNVKTKRKFTEMCFEVEYVLNTIGISQGKKRNLLGFDDFLNDNNHGEVGKDRYDLACALLGIEMKSSTLRKAMKVFWSDFNPDCKSESGIIELLDENQISIDKAHKLISDRDRKKNEKKSTERAKMEVAQSSLNEDGKPYKLFCKSSLIMDEISDNSIPMVIYSPPYAGGQRKYRNQDELRYGQEPTREEYLDNFKAHNKEVYRVTKPGGVVVCIIGENYQEGYQGICTRAELIMEEIGFKVLDVPTLVKSNQKYAPHNFRFMNSQERIIVAHKPGEDPYFTPVYRKGSVDGYKAKRTKSGGLYIASPETCITNVIETPVFNPNILREIDPDFQHDAPCPPEVYQIFIEAYSRPGDEILDIHVGSGTIGVSLAMGRKVIGYDVDPISIVFSQKRFEWYLNQTKQDAPVEEENILATAA